MALYCSYYESAWGLGAVTASENGLLQVLLPEIQRDEGGETMLTNGNADPVESTLSRDAARLLCRYFDGEPIVFDLALDMGDWTTFGAAVYGVVRAIPAGEVRSYGAVAAACGHPGAARAVGRMMAINRLPIIIPCHRVVAANGALTGYSAPGGLPFKAKLLALEGVVY